MSDIKKILGEIEQIQADLKKTEEEISTILTKIRKAERKIALEKRKGAFDTSSEAYSALTQLQGDLDAKKNHINERKLILQEKWSELSGINKPEDIIRLCSNKVPFLMFPVRIETKYMHLNTDHPELWVRIYPDDIAVDTHEESFKEEEIEMAKFYFSELQRAKPKEDRIKTELTAELGEDEEKQNVVINVIGEEPFLSDGDINSLTRLHFTQEEIDAGKEYWTKYKGIREEIKIPAWIEMVNAFGPFRSAYIVSKGRDYFAADEIPLKPESWSRAPQSYIMPDYFVIRLYRKTVVNERITHELWKEEKGNLIKYPLAVGPDPLSEDEDPNRLFFDQNSQWMIDFDKAVEAGMGLKVDLSGLLEEGNIDQGFSRIIALGIKTPTSVTSPDVIPPEEQRLVQTLCDLFEHHHYTGGFSFLKQGTPTNNTAETESEYNSSEENYEESYKLEVLTEHFPEEAVDTDNNAETKDGFRFARVLGLTENIGIFNHIFGADETDNQDAKQMAIALWPVTWGTYLTPEFFGKAFYNIDIEELQKHFIEYVRGRASYPAIRVDEMPYGILPVSAFSLWQERNDEPKREFYQGLGNLLYNLSLYWLKLSEDVEKIPRAGASDDPDKELVQILGMQASSYSFRIRSVISENYLQDLLKFVWPSLFKAESLWTRIRNILSRSRNSGSDSNGENTESDSYKTFWDEYLKEKQESGQLFRQMTNREPYAPILDTTTWGDGYDLNIPLVQESPVSETKPLVNNYIQTLYDTNLEDIRSDSYEGEEGEVEVPPSTVLFMLLRQAVLSSNIDWENDNEPIRKSFRYLAALPSAKLERLVSEVLDLSAHRLDAWIISLITRRLEELRSDDNVKGSFIGAYGWLEDLKPKADKSSGGYIHAPSISHGITAAVLRNAYLTHAESENADRMSVNLCSERVKKSLWFIEGIRQGQSLNVLLGYRFERSLHEIHKKGNTVLYLDQCIVPLRKLYPLDAGKVTEIAEDEDVEALAPHNVVDGLALLKAYRGENEIPPIPFDINRDLPNTGSAKHKAIIQELEDLDETFDAISDLMLSESVHRAVLSDYLGSGAVLDSTSADGSPPDEFLVSKTPRGGVNIKHHCVVLFPASSESFLGEEDCFLDQWPDTKRSTLSPFLNAWAAKIIGDPEKIICHAEYVYDNEIIRLKLNLLGVIDPETNVVNTRFGISPLDLIYLSVSSLKSESTELEEIMTYSIKKDRHLAKDIEISFSYARDEHFSDDERSFAQVMPLARTMLKLITSTSYLKPQDLYLPEETEVGDGENIDTDFTGFSVANFEWIRDKIKKDENSGIYVDLKTLHENLLGAVENSNITQIRQYMEQAIQYSFMGAVPKSAKEDDEVSLKELTEQAQSVLGEIYRRLVNCQTHLGKANSLTGITDEDSTDIKNDKRASAIDQLIQCFKAILGKSFVFIPRFTASNFRELLLSFDHSDTLLNGEDERWPLMWFQQAAHTHPNLRSLESLMMLVEIQNNQSLELSIGQLPYRENDRWVALPWKDGMDREAKERVQGTLSIVKCSPFAVDYSKKIAGIVLDKWDEIIPSEEETTSLVYQYNRPSSEAPNTCLLCVSPVLDTEDGKWQWEHLVKCVEETLDMVKIRAVDSDAFKKLGRFLPAIYMKGQAQRNNSNLSLKFPFSIMRKEE